MDVLELADQLVKLPMYPYFDMCHMVICCLASRAELGQGGSLSFSRRHPFACWLASMLSIFSSALLSNFMLNEPIVGAFSNTQHVLLATLVWYAIYYTPLDLGARFCQFLPIRSLIEASNEIYRCHRVHHGVTLTSRIYPTSYFAILLMGVVQGNSPGLIRFLERIFRGASWVPAIGEFMQPSYATKFSLLASIVFLMDRKGDQLWFWWQAPHNLVYMCLVAFCIYFKLSTLLFGLQDPFLPLENLMGALLFGGIWDAIARVLAHTSQRFNRVQHPLHHFHQYNHPHHQAYYGANQSWAPASVYTPASSTVIAGPSLSPSSSLLSGPSSSPVPSSSGHISQPVSGSFRAELLRNGNMCMAVDKRQAKNREPQ